MGKIAAATTTWRRKRLEQLLNLALAYKDCTRKELAGWLGRDPTKLVPGTGIPKLDLVVQLASVIDWPVGDVVAFLWNDHPPRTESGELADFRMLEHEAAQAEREGRHRTEIDMAAAAYSVADTPQERAAACHREARAWERLGHHARVVQALTRGINEKGLASCFRRTLQADLARAYYALWSLVESRSISHQLCASYEAGPPRTSHERRTHASAHECSGQTFRRLLMVEPKRTRALASCSRVDLRAALDLYDALAGEGDDDAWQGRVNTCRGALIEVEAVLGRRRPFDALCEISTALDVVGGTGELPPPVLESYGWWCIYGCNIALRHLTDERELHQHMAVLTNKAEEIATVIDNWPIRERVFSMQYTRWERAMGSTGFEIPHVIDNDDIRIIIGTMGRFPSFRETGWHILQTAQIVDG